VNVVDAAQRVLLTEMVPPTVFVHERGDVVVVHGRTGMFLEPAQGAQARPNIFNMAREGLQISLSRCLREAAASSDEVVVRGVEVRTNGTRVAFDLRAQRLARPEALRGVIRLSFENTRPVPPDATETALVVDPGASERMVDLERELLSSKESHQDTIEQLETANEELQSANEELQSTNEELQSANEELETSKEEMQSLNEELQTVNAELQAKLEDISRANNDMKNLLNGTEIATVFVDHELRIKRFTERAKQVIRLIESDIGRPIGDLASTLRYDRLIEDAQDVLRTLVVKETEVRSDSGETYLTRILPYRTTDNVIEGLVFTFVDITKLKAVQAEQDRLVDVLQRSPVGVFGQDRDLRITWTADAVFGRPSDTLLGKTDADLLEPADAEALTAVKRGVLEQGVPARQRTTLAVDGRHHTYDLYLEPQRDDAGRVVGLSCVAVDLTTEEVTA
jgi:two-component system CheB/CheR fusion protein